MGSFEIYGGNKLKGNLIPQGAKNEALQVLNTVLLTKEEVIISNILGSGLSIEASVDGNSIYIREQTVGNLRIVGEGFYQPVTGRIQINYEYNYSGSSRACTAFFQRF